MAIPDMSKQLNKKVHHEQWNNGTRQVLLLYNDTAHSCPQHYSLKVHIDDIFAYMRMLMQPYTPVIAGRVEHVGNTIQI